MLTEPTGSAIGSHAMLLARLRRLSVGEEVELRGLGRSLWPIITSGDRVIVRRVGEAEVGLGDIVVAWLPERESLVCHVLTALNPMETAALFGEFDGRAEVLAKVVRIEGSGRWRFRLGSASPVVQAVRKVGRFAKGRGWTTSVRAGIDAVLATSGGVTLRAAALGPLEARRLTVDDLETAAIFAGHHLPSISGTWLETQLRGAWREGRGGAVGVFDRHGELRAFGILGSYRDEGVDVPGMWLRFLYTSPAGRKLGAMRGVVRSLLAMAVEQGLEEVLSDIRSDNVRSLILHRSHGFRELRHRELAPYDRLLERNSRLGREIRILRWRAPNVSPNP